MNQLIELTAKLGDILGHYGRAVWLAVRVDELPLWQVARDTDTSVGDVREALRTADWVLDTFPLVQPAPPLRPLRTCWDGFHQMGDGDHIPFRKINKGASSED